jgi:hypothetical protein
LVYFSCFTCGRKDIAKYIAMNTVLSIVGECLLVAVMAILSAFAIVPAQPAWALFVIFCSLSLLDKRSPAESGGLRRDQKFLLFLAFFLAIFWPFQMGTVVSSTSALTLSVVCLLFGIICTLEDLKTGRQWSQIRWEIFLSVIILIVASSVTVIANRVLVDHVSQIGIVPGGADFLLDMAVLATVWFGVDAALHRQSLSQREDIKGRIWNIRNMLLLFLTAVVVWLRAGLL